MGEKEIEVIEVGDSCPSPRSKGTPLRSIFCLKNRHEMKKFEEHEECFILEFDPYNDLQVMKLPASSDDCDLLLVAEKGQVACRDYPHPRHSCARYPFKEMPHEKYCKLCYCYVCDLPAPCKYWSGFKAHCHAIKNEAWDEERRRLAKRLAWNTTSKSAI